MSDQTWIEIIKDLAIIAASIFGVIGAIFGLWNIFLLIKNRFQSFYKCDTCPIGLEKPGFCDEKYWRCIRGKCTCPCHRTRNRNTLRQYDVNYYI